jgi:hypothetical protein
MEEPGNPTSGGRRRVHRRPWRPFPFHPLLFAAFPVLYLLAHNVDERISWGDALRPLGLVVGVAAAVLVVATLAYRDPRKAALAVSPLALLFLSYGRFNAALEGRRVMGVAVGRPVVLLTVWVVLSLWIVLLAARARRWIPELTKVLNAVALGLVLINLSTIVVYQVRVRHMEQAAINASAAGLEGSLPDREEARAFQRLKLREPPDIYYIVVEEYAGAATLRNRFDFDNSAFLDALHERGFYLPADATCNYPHTSLSVASSMNMEYLDFLTDKLGRSSGDTHPLRDMTGFNRMGRFLKSIGYRYVHIGSWWNQTRTSPEADENIVFGGYSELASTLYGTTALRPIADEDRRMREWKRVQFQFSALEATRRLEGPTFVFAHILSTHDPYVFNPDGSYKTEDAYETDSREVNYIDALAFTNRKILRLIDGLLSTPQESRPVIVIQADEGPYENLDPGWLTLEPQLLRQKFSILNAFYLPGAESSRLYPTITPVNSFRLIFSSLFGANLPLLPDRNYVYRDRAHLYDLRDVTDQVRAALSEGPGTG